MTLVDANLLIYAYSPGSDKHDAAKRWLSSLFNSGELAAFTWAGLLAFIRITTDARIYSPPAPIEEAVQRVAEILNHPRVAVLEPTPRHWPILASLLTEGQARGPLAMDADIAALAIEHGALLASTDRDFSRFPGLRYTNPLQPKTDG